MNTYSFTCPTNGIRLDKFLAQARPTLSRNRVRQLIIAGHVRVNGEPPVKVGLKLSAGMEITLTEPNITVETPPAPKNIPLDILYEDDVLLALNKPAGLVVHPAVGHTDDTLVNALLHHYPEMAARHAERPGIVHRLDRDTSGVMVVAKTALALENLQAQFKARAVEKIYLALVHGIPRSAEGVIDVPLGRHPTLRQKFAPRPNGKPARTHYWIEETFAAFSLLRIKLETGRTHQIRVHLAWLGHPVAGDTVYGHKKNRLKLSRQFLHAYSLSVQHPIRADEMTFTAPLPAELARTLELLR